MSSLHDGGCAVVLQDGRILVGGGSDASGATAKVEIFNTDGSWSSAPPMLSPRTHQACAALQDGQVLVAGGTTTGGGVTNSAEIFDPVANAWSQLSPMSEARAGATTSLLQDGRVLLAGGQTTAGPSNGMEIFDPSSQTFNFAGTMSASRQDAATVLLQDGRVLIVGGSGVDANGNAAVLGSSDIYDPSTGSVSPGPTLVTARSKHSATVQLDGKVAVIGGNDGSNDLASIEVYDPLAAGNFAVGAASLVTPRSGHLAFLLPKNNQVLVVGGQSGGVDMATAELYVPWGNQDAGADQSTGSMAAARSQASGAPLSTADGLLLVAGGSAQTSGELYSFATVSTDQSDYAPGTTVTITGGGWQPGETVTLTLVESPPIDSHPVMTAVADQNGNIFNNQFSPDSHDVNVRFYLTATGSQSQAQNTFTDAPGDNTSTAVACSPASLTAGSSTTCTATVSNTQSGAPNGYPQGVVTFSFNGTGSFTPVSGTCTVAQVGSSNNSSCSVTLTPTAAGSGLNAKGNFNSSDPNKWKNGVSQNFGLTVVAAPTASLTASPSTITSGHPATLTPTFSGGTGSIDHGIGAVTNGVGVAVSPTATTTYTLTVTNTLGATATSQVVVTVVAPPSITSFVASPSTINSGSSSTLTGVFAGGTGSVDQGVGAVTSGVGASVSPTTTTLYTLTVTNAAGNTATATARVTVNTVVPTTTAIVSGSGQTTTYGSAVPNPLVAQVSASGSTPTGTASLSVDGGSVVDTEPLDGSGRATFAGTFASALSTGGHSLHVAYTPTSGSIFVASSSSPDGSVTITQATPVITWAAPTDIVYGTALSATQLNATASVPGAFAYSPAAGTVLNAGSAQQLSVTFTPTDTTNYASAVKSVAINVSKANATIAANGYTGVYDGNAHRGSGTATGVSNEDLSSSLHFTAGFTDVPGGTVNWTFDGNNNYTSASGSVQIVISQAQATVNVTGYSGVYDGNAHGATGTATGVKGEDLSALLNLGSSFTDVPGGTANWAFAGNTNYKSANGSAVITITQADASVKVNGYTGVYDGNAHGATGMATGVKGEDLSALLNLGSSFTDVPGGTANWAFAGNTNYKSANGSAVITITQADASVKVNGYTGVYDGNAHGATGMATGVKGEDLSALLNLGSSFTDVPGGTANWAFAGNTNYKSANGSAVITITQADANIKVNGYTGVYDGNAHGATGTATGVKGEDLSALLNLGSSFSDVPGGTANWAFAGNTNYKSTNGSAVITITQADANIKVNGYTGVYDGNAHGATGTATGVKGEDLSSLLNFGASFTDVPGGTANWAFAGNTNYKSASGTAAVVITQADASISVQGYTGVYDGNAHGATGTATGVKGENLSNLLALGASFTDVPGGTANWTFAGNTNYKAASGNAVITLTPAQANITVTGYTGTYDGNAHGATGSALGVKGENLSNLLNLGVTFTDVPGGTANWSFAGNINYQPANGPVPIVINKADSSVTITVASVTFDGNQHGGTAVVTGAGGLNHSLMPNYAGTTFSGAAYVLTQTQPMHAGTYELNANFVGDNNHNPSSASANFSIFRASSSTAVTVPGGASFTYDSNPHPASVSVTGAGGLNLTPAPLYNCGHVPTYVADNGCIASYNYPGDNDHTASSGNVTYSITPAPLAATANSMSMVLDAPLPQLKGSLAGVLGADGISATYTTAATGTVIGTFPITPVLSDPNNRLPNYNLTSNNGTLTVQYAAAGVCYGDYGHQILAPVAANGTSTFKQGSTIPAKFRVCDALGNSISAVSATGVPVVSQFNLIGIISGTVTQTVDQTVTSTTPDTAFRWDATGQQWIFNISTKPLSIASTYVYQIVLNDGSKIQFQYGLPR